jgi:3',5'-cyclic AMP phosphodiesterase CpdA
MKFLHLSDLHITADDTANEPIRQRLAYCAQKYRDHFFIVTGDIIDNEGAVPPGTPVPHEGGNIAAVAPTFMLHPPPPLGPIKPHLDRAITSLQKAAQLFSLLPSGRVFLVPGNHDYGLVGNIYGDEFIQAFDDYLFSRINRNTDGSFTVATTVLSADLSLRSMSARFPISYVIAKPGQPTVALLGLNTIGEPSLDPTVFGTGLVGPDQLASISRYFFGANLLPNLGQSLGICQIAFFHHHPWTHSDPAMKLRDADQLLARLRNKIDLILFGHRHREKRYLPAEVPGGGLRFGAIASGSSREEKVAWEIDIVSADDWRFNPMPIV